MPVCSNCGIIQDSGTHCGECGERLVTAQGDATPTPVPDPAPGSEPRPEFVGANRGTIDQRTDRSQHRHEDHSRHETHNHHDAKSTLPLTLGALAIFALTVVALVYMFTQGMLPFQNPSPVASAPPALSDPGFLKPPGDSQIEPPSGQSGIVEPDLAMSTPMPSPTSTFMPTPEPGVYNPIPDSNAVPSALPPDPRKVALQLFIEGDDATTYAPMILNTFSAALTGNQWIVIDGAAEPYNPGYVMTIDASFAKQARDFQGLEKEMLELTLDVSITNLLDDGSRIHAASAPAWSHATRLPSLLRESLAEHLQSAAKISTEALGN